MAWLAVYLLANLVGFFVAFAFFRVGGDADEAGPFGPPSMEVIPIVAFALTPMGMQPIGLEGFEGFRKVDLDFEEY
jgi:hypothetical protein